MRKTAKGVVTVRAISGTHVVFLAFGMARADATGLMGFAIQRADLTDQETTWLRGIKTFASIRPPTGFEDASSHEHPFQTFQWADYAAKPGYRYRYRVIPMYGRPGALTEGRATNVTIATEPLTGRTHDVHFNRGAIASQAFTRRFPGMSLVQAGAPAYAWLTRDLLPGLLDFIAGAKDARHSLRAAVYELKWPEVLAAFKAAADRGVDVKIVYHARDDSTGAENERQIDDAGIRALCIARRKAPLMHNKFIVHGRAGKASAVWTGSTNFSRNALFGQLNVGHAVRDRAVAAAFRSYWDALALDPEPATVKAWTLANNPIPPADATLPLTAMFSPRRGRAAFDGWIDLASSEGKPLFMTFPFGIVRDFRPCFDRNDGVLRFAMLDKYVNGGSQASREEAIAEIERIRRFPNIGLALGNAITVDWVDGWRRELDPIGVNVNWVHTKFMLVDPLGEQPVTVTGSANWSLPSVDTNDENMVVVRGDKRVADIYFGEFMRIFAHHRFRESLKRHIEQHGAAAAQTWKPQNLFEDWRQWIPAQFRPGSEYDIKRRYFVGG